MPVLSKPMKDMRSPVLAALVMIALAAGVGALGQFRAAGPQVSVLAQNPAAIHREDCYGFELSNLKVNHQGKNVLRITVLYRYAAGLKTADYMDVNELRDDVLKTIHTYPNTKDYWEVYSARIADHLFARFSTQLDALRLKLEIAPGPGEPFARTSLVVRSHSGSLPLIP